MNFNLEQLIDQLKREHDQRLEDLKIEIDAVNRLLDLELRRVETAPQAQSAPAREPVHHAARHAPQPPQPVQAPAQPPVALADFLIRKLNEAGAMSRDDLRRFSLQEGYFTDAESADRGVHGTLLNVVKAGLIRQLPNGNFAPATVLDTIRLRRAM